MNPSSLKLTTPTENIFNQLYVTTENRVVTPQILQYSLVQVIIACTFCNRFRL